MRFWCAWKHHPVPTQAPNLIQTTEINFFTCGCGATRFIISTSALNNSHRSVLFPLLSFTFSWVFGDFLCKMYQFVHSLSYTASIFILVVICMERYFAIIHPITCKQILTSRRLRVSKGATGSNISIGGKENTHSFPLKRTHQRNAFNLDFPLFTRGPGSARSKGSRGR